MIRNACKSVRVLMRIIHAAVFKFDLLFLSMCDDTQINQQVHSTIQGKPLNEAAINNNKLTHDTFLFCIIIKMLITLKRDSQMCK